MTSTNKFECRLNSDWLQEDTITNPVQVVATPILGSEDLQVISDKCSGCRVSYLRKGQPRVISAMGSEIWRCKSTDDCYLDEQLAIAVTLNSPTTIIASLVEQVHNNEKRRIKRMFNDYIEPETITILRQRGVYPYPTPWGEE